jgi:DNA-binding CsgD family transcriptional regulator
MIVSVSGTADPALRILRIKLGATSRAEAIAHAHQQGLL